MTNHPSQICQELRVKLDLIQDECIQVLESTPNQKEQPVAGINPGNCGCSFSDIIAHMLAMELRFTKNISDLRLELLKNSIMPVCTKDLLIRPKSHCQKIFPRRRFCGQFHIHRSRCKIERSEKATMSCNGSEYEEEISEFCNQQTAFSMRRHTDEGVVRHCRGGGGHGITCSTTPAFNLLHPMPNENGTLPRKIGSEISNTQSSLTHDSTAPAHGVCLSDIHNENTSCQSQQITETSGAARVEPANLSLAAADRRPPPLAVDDAIDVLEVTPTAVAPHELASNGEDWDDGCDSSDSAHKEVGGQHVALNRFERARQALLGLGLFPTGRRSSFHTRRSTIDVHRARRLSFVGGRRTLRCGACAGTPLERGAREVLARVFGICEYDLQSGRPGSSVIYPNSPFANGRPAPRPAPPRGSVVAACSPSSCPKRAPRARMRPRPPPARVVKRTRPRQSCCGTGQCIVEPVKLLRNWSTCCETGQIVAEPVKSLQNWSKLLRIRSGFPVDDPGRAAWAGTC